VKGERLPRGVAEPSRPLVKNPMDVKAVQARRKAEPEDALGNHFTCHLSPLTFHLSPPPSRRISVLPRMQ
jgi:hypothetical protein